MDGMTYVSRHTVNLTAASDLIEITSPSDAVSIIKRLTVSQQDLTADEFLQVFGQRASASGSGGTAITPRPTQVGYGAAGATVEGANTTGATLTEDETIEEEWNVRGNPFDWHPTKDEWIYLSPSGIYAFRLNVAPSAGSDFRIRLVHTEVGG